MAQFVKAFYAPISAGSMAHTGAIPQSNVSYPVPHPVGGNLSIIQRGSQVGSPTLISGPQGYLPQPLTTFDATSTRSRSVSGTVSHQPNFFNHPNT